MNEPSRGATLLERVLGAFTRVERGEARPALALVASVFLVLTAYYFIKPAREGWLSVSLVKGLSKIEVKAYSGFAQALLLFAAVYGYDRVVARWPRRTLVTRVHLLFLSNLAIFWLLQPGLLADTVPFAGIAFYLWVGIFNVFIVAQFWSFATDFYDPERGRRLLPLIAIGAAGGAVFGSWLAGRLVALPAVGSYDLILLAALPLLAGTLLLRRADRLGPLGEGAAPRPPPAAPAAKAHPVGAISLVRRNRYLTATAALTLIFGWAGANGENVLFGAVQQTLADGAAAEGLTDAAIVEEFVRDGTTAFYGDYYFWINTGALLLQSFVASRLLRFGGFGALLLLLPLITTLGYAAMAFHPVIAWIKPIKVIENSTNYSIHNTARHVLWLPTTAEMKYKAKQAIDTLCVRLGDGLAALTVLVGIAGLGLAPTSLFWVNVPLGIVWLALGAFIVREHRRVSRPESSNDAA